MPGDTIVCIEMDSGSNTNLIVFDESLIPTTIDSRELSVPDHVDDCHRPNRP